MSTDAKQICGEFKKTKNPGFVGVGSCGGDLLVLAVPGHGVREQLREAGFVDVIDRVTDSSSHFLVEDRADDAVPALHPATVPSMLQLRVHPGHRCKREGKQGGSVGCLLEDPSDRDLRYVLTAEHVLWADKVHNKDVLNHANERIGVYCASSDIWNEASPVADWGLVELTDAEGWPDPACRYKLTFQGGFATNSEIDGAHLEQCGAEFYRGPGLACATDWCAVVHYEREDQTKEIWFDHHIVVRRVSRKQSFAKRGHSGAFVYFEPNRRKDPVKTVGLVVAVTSDEDFALVVPLRTVMNELPNKYSHLEPVLS